jgi:hypothetical protein
MGTKLTRQEIEKIQQKQEALKMKKDKERIKDNNQTIRK